MAQIRQRVGKNGTRYMAVVRREGQSRTATFRTKSEALKWAGLIEAEITKGKHLPPTESKRKSVRNLMTRYIDTVIPNQKDQRNPKRHAMFWIERIGDLKLSRLNPAILVEVRDELAKDKAAGTVNRYLAVISHACTLAEREWGWLQSNPVRKVSRLSEPQGRVRYLCEVEWTALLKATGENKHPYLHCAVLIAITTGARKNEILSLMWNDIELRKGRAVLGKTKNKERRVLTLVPKIVAELRKLQKVRVIGVDQVFVDPSTGTPSRNRFEEAWRAARDSVGIEDFRFHDLRHTAASNLAMNGATTAEIAAVLGHKTLQMVKRYSHLSDDHVRGVVEKTAIKVLGDG